MFAEELCSNSSKKRAEANRAKRRQLKQQHQVKSKTASSVVSEGGAVMPVIVAASASDVTPVQNVERSSDFDPGSSKVSSSFAASKSLAGVATSSNIRGRDEPLSAVARAQHLRLVRHAEAQEHARATKVQAFYRAHRAQKTVVQVQTQLLAKRLHDLEQIAIFLAEQKTKSKAFCPPPATITQLTQQMCFVFEYHGKYSTDMTHMFELLQDFLSHALLLGLTSSDENMNPSLVWLQTSQGTYRLKRVLRIVMDALFHQQCLPGAAQFFVQRFLVAVLQDAPAPTRRYCQSLVLPERRSLDSNNDLDMICQLRHYLLYKMSSDGHAIPHDAATSREASILSNNRIVASAAWQLLQEQAQTSIMLQARMMHELCTVPLFFYKLSLEEMTSMVAPGPGQKVLFKGMLRSWVKVHGGALASAQHVDECLKVDDLNLRTCPAKPSQCFLANLVQFGRQCAAVNGSCGMIDYDFGALYYDIITVLLDAVPLLTFSSRDSVVEWVAVENSGHSQPIVLSPIVLEQCRALVTDASWIRRLVNIAIDSKALETDSILKTKTEEDLRCERDLAEVAASSVADLAAKEARIDRNRKFWNSSKWAKKLSQSMVGMFAHDQAGAKPPSAEAALRDTSAESRQLAGGSALIQKRTTSRPEYSMSLLLSLCRMIAVFVGRWGGGGRDIVHSNTKEHADATSRAEPTTLALLNVLCFSTSLLQAAWAITQTRLHREIEAIVEADKGKTEISALRITPTLDLIKVAPKQSGAAVLLLFVAMFGHILIVTDDVEIHDMEKPIPLHQIRRCILLLKKLLYRACCIDLTSDQPSYLGLSLISVCSKLMRELFDRSSRRPLCVPKMWLVRGLLDHEIKKCKSHSDFVSVLSSPVLKVCPFLVPFKRRLELFERIITTCRIDIQGEQSPNPFHTNPLKPGIPIRIMRGRILEDGLATMNNLGKNMRQRLSVNYVNQAGVRETGVDAGGLFKEFWTDLSAVAFNANYALFQKTEGGSDCLYPSPSSFAVHGSEHIVLFEFLGRILGKALFENITIHPRFAHFFLSSLRGDYNYFHMLPDLSTVDLELYNSLMFLKTYEGDARDLCLSFTVTTDEFGSNKDLPLIFDGGNVEVTNENKQRYIGLVAKYYVVDRVREQSEAFTRGLWEVIDRSWLHLFNEPELQILISGASEKIDVDDMRANARYAGGYTGIDRNVHRFWNVVRSMNSQEQGALLRFVTSCERPPPLGFASLNPPLTIQRIGIMRDGDKLPSSSTCFNILKLPTYSSEKVLKERLLYAIHSGAGFELT